MGICVGMATMAPAGRVTDMDISMEVGVGLWAVAAATIRQTTEPGRKRTLYVRFKGRFMKIEVSRPSTVPPRTSIEDNVLGRLACNKVRGLNEGLAPKNLYATE